MKKRVLLVILAAALSGCAAAPETVAERLTEAVNARDVEGALALFAPDAVVSTGGPAPYAGAEQIRAWLEELAAGNFTIEAEIVEVRDTVVVEREKMSMDEWRAIGIRSLEGVSEITVEDGLIQSLEFAFTEASLAQLQQAILQATQPTHPNLRYLDGQVPEHVLDLYLPQQGGGPFPAVLMVHGDGDTKEQHNGMAGFLNQAGLAVALVDYREYPYQIEDVACSLAWLRANAGQFAIDPDRITLFGFSVGGIAAATVGALDDPAAAAQCGGPLPSEGAVAGVAIYEGVLGTPEGCFSASWCLAGASAGLGIPVSELLPIFEVLKETPPARWGEADLIGPDAQAFAAQFPLYWLDGSEPPYLVIHGAGDEGIPRTESEAFAAHLESAGVPVDLLLLPTASHQSVYPSSASFGAIAQAVADFALGR